MLGSAIPRRWVVSLALVGLVSLFMASYAAVWANPASATTGTTVAATSTPAPAGSVLTDLTVSSTLNLQPGQVVVISASPIDDDGKVDLNMPGVTYTWSAGSCGSLNSTTSRTPEFTAVDSGCSAGTITVHANQGGGSNIPSGGAKITVNVSNPPATALPTAVLTAADDGALFTTDAGWNAALAGGATLTETGKPYTANARGAGVVPSKSSSVEIPTGASLSISAGSLDSGESKVVTVDTIELADLQAPPPPAVTGSTSGTFRFGSSAIQISFLDGADGAANAGKTTLNKPAQVCMPYTKADSDGAYGGVNGLKIWHYNGTEWVALNTTVLGSPSRVCAYTSSFSPFALGLDVEPPTEAGGETGLPATGGYTPNAMTLLLAMFAGFALVGTGVVAARRARRAGVNS